MNEPFDINSFLNKKILNESAEVYEYREPTREEMKQINELLGYDEPERVARYLDFTVDGWTAKVSYLKGHWDDFDFDCVDGWLKSVAIDLGCDKEDLNHFSRNSSSFIADDFAATFYRVADDEKRPRAVSQIKNYVDECYELASGIIDAIITTKDHIRSGNLDKDGIKNIRHLHEQLKKIELKKR